MPQRRFDALRGRHQRLVGGTRLTGALVVRLKGGDISIFSNVLDELQTLVENAIPYELVPGVTAALGAAAYAGIPLTARGYSTAVRLLTAYRQDLLNEPYWCWIWPIPTIPRYFICPRTAGSSD